MRGRWRRFPLILLACLQSWTRYRPGCSVWTVVSAVGMVFPSGLPALPGREAQVLVRAASQAWTSPGAVVVSIAAGSIVSMWHPSANLGLSLSLLSWLA